MKKFFVTFAAVALLMQLTVCDTISQEQGKGVGKGRSGQKRMARGRMRGEDKAPKVGEKAPTFVLKSLDGESETDLESFQGEKPVLLLFGSYT